MTQAEMYNQQISTLASRTAASDAEKAAIFQQYGITIPG
jgi:hypothetical protein